MAGRLTETRKRWRLVGLAVFVAGIVVLGWSRSQLVGRERIYESSVILLVAQPAGLEGENGGRMFVEFEIGIIISDEVLYPVVKGLRLDEQWSLTSEQSVLMLRGLMVVEEVEEREEKCCISVAVRSPDAELAREIASRVATEYQGQGNARAREAFEREVEALGYEIAEQKRLVDEKRLKLEKAHREARQKLREAHLSMKDLNVSS